MLISAFVVPALAGPFEDAVTQFSEGSFADSEEAVTKLAVTGNPMASAIIGALQDGRLTTASTTRSAIRAGASPMSTTMAPDGSSSAANCDSSSPAFM